MTTIQRSKRFQAECIAHLPVELWVAILSHTSQSSTIRLSWTNRNLRHITISDPWLWTDFHFPAQREHAMSQPCTCPDCSPSKLLPATTGFRGLKNTVARLEAFLERSQSQPFQVWFDLHRHSILAATVQHLLDHAGLLLRVSFIQVKSLSTDLRFHLGPVRRSTDTRFASLKTLNFVCSGGAREPDPLLPVMQSGMLDGDTVTKARLPPGMQWHRSWGPFPAIEQLEVNLLDFNQFAFMLDVMPGVCSLHVGMSHDVMNAGNTDALVPILRQDLSRLKKLTFDSFGPVLSWTMTQLLTALPRDENRVIPEVALYGLEFQDECLLLLNDLSGDISLQFTVIRNLANGPKEWHSIIALNSNGISRELRFWLSDISKDATWFFRLLLLQLHAVQITNLLINWNLLRRFISAAGLGCLSNVNTLTLMVPPEQAAAAPEKLFPMPKLQHLTFSCEYPNRTAPLPAASVRSLIEKGCGGRHLGQLDVRSIQTEIWNENERAGLRGVVSVIYGLSSVWVGSALCSLILGYLVSQEV